MTAATIGSARSMSPSERDQRIEQAKMEIGASILEMQYLAQRKAEVLQRLSRAYQTVALASGAQHVDSDSEV